MIDQWKKLYASDQENLYRNPLVRMLFDLGHRYIARRGRHIRGSILDVGSGIGYHIQFEHITAQRKYICLDSNKGMLDQIKHAHVSKLHASADNIPLPEKSINLIIASHILEHIPTLDRCLEEFNRILVDKGTLLIVLPCDPGFLWNLLTYFSPSRGRLKKLGLNYDVVMKHEHVNSFDSCMQQLSRAFTVIDTTYYPFLFKNHHLNVMCCLTLKKRI